MIEVVFTEHLSRPSLDVSPGAIADRRRRVALTIDGCQAVAFFRPLAAWALKRELVVKGFGELEMPAVAQDGEEIGQHVLSSENVGRLCALDSRGHDGAARFMLLTAARREEVVGAVWVEIDLEKGTWTIPASRRKDTRAPSRRRRRAAADVVVPLSRQARALLETLGPGKPTDFVFVGGRGAKLTNWPR